MNPYLAIETLEDLHRARSLSLPETTWDKVFKSYVKSIDKGASGNIFQDVKFQHAAELSGRANL